MVITTKQVTKQELINILNNTFDGDDVHEIVAVITECYEYSPFSSSVEHKQSITFKNNLKT